MNNECVFQLKDNYILRKIADSYMIVPIGDQIANFGGIIEASTSVSILWDMLKDGSTEDALVAKLLDTYDVSKEQAEADIHDLLSIMNKRGMLR